MNLLVTTCGAWLVSPTKHASFGRLTLQRRNFIKSGLVSLASVSALGSSGFGQPLAQGSDSDSQKFTLSNKYLDWELLIAGGTFKSIGLRNKLSGRFYEIHNSSEFSLTFSKAKARAEIPWWYVHMGPDDDRTAPAQENGYLAGYHLQDFRGEEEWGTTLNLLLRDARRVNAPPTFSGYAWFRQWFELPDNAKSEPVVFCLGGYTQEDWNEYWIYVNGKMLGNWTKSGRWRTPEVLIVQPGSREHGALQFGSGAKNLLAVRTRHYDKRFEGIRDEILDRFIFEGRLCDQFISVGEPYLRVADFKLRNWRQEGEGDQPKFVFSLANTQEQLELSATFELDQFTRRKWFEIKNLAPWERLLLDVDVDDFNIPAETNEGDYGFPVMIADEVFCALEHPAGVNQGMGGRVRLRHHPGKKLAAGGTLTSRVSIVGVAPRGEGRQQFVDYIQARSPRKKMLGIYDPLGINGFPDHPCWTLNDDEMLDTLKLLEKWQKRGVRFDYYVPDVGWQDWTGDLTRFWPQCFPEGPTKVIKKVNELGMKWGLWFAGTWADWSCGLNPIIAPSRTVVPGGKWPDFLFRDGFDIYDGSRQLCMASEPYFSKLRDALLYHIRNYNLRFFKLDTSSYYCNSTEHNHLPGKYSTEANFDAVIDLAHAMHQASPDLYIMWYWGIRSPFFALHGDSIFESRIRMEAASTGDYPALFFRDAVTLALDQGVRFNDLIPPMNKDSLGVWITDTWWGNAMGKERWREAIVMDLARGNLLFPQIWGDLYRFNDEDVDFLARIQRVAKENEAIFYKRKTILGDPWNNEVYGYAYFDGVHGFLFMNNVNFQSRPVKLKLNETIGLKAPAGVGLKIISHFPENAELRQGGQPVFKSGQSLQCWLRPFEVAMWEIFPESQAGKETISLPERELPAGKAEVESQRLDFELEAVSSGMEIYYGEPEPHFRSSMQRPTVEEFKRMGFEKRILARRAMLPKLGSGPHVLAVVLRFRKDGKWWRYRQPGDLVQAKATIGEQPIIRFETVPNFRQTENNESCPWLVFKIRMNPAWSGKGLTAAVNAYLPPEVEVQCEAWVVPKWWT
jgi:hypothetical protein